MTFVCKISSVFHFKAAKALLTIYKTKECDHTTYFQSNCYNHNTINKLPCCLEILIDCFYVQEVGFNRVSVKYNAICILIYNVFNIYHDITSNNINVNRMLIIKTKVYSYIFFVHFLHSEKK